MVNYLKVCPLVHQRVKRRVHLELLKVNKNRYFFQYHNKHKLLPNLKSQLYRFSINGKEKLRHHYGLGCLRNGTIIRLESMQQTNCSALLLQVPLYPREHLKGSTKLLACIDLKQLKKTMVILLLNKLDKVGC